MSRYAVHARFIQDNFSIINKGGREVNFELNPVQQKFVNEATGRDVILKARQQGMSSFILAAFTADFILKDNSLSVIVADVSENAQDLLSRVKHYIAAWEATNKVKLPLKYNSKYELYNSSVNSRYIIGTSENTNFGRSKTITNLHLSEPAFYSHFVDILAGAGTALTENGKFVIETTANGYNEFKTFWDKSVLGETGFTPHFFKASEFYNPQFLSEEKARLGRLFDQEYPETAEQAFLTSGNTFFSKEAMQYYLTEVDRYEPLTTVGW